MLKEEVFSSNKKDIDTFKEILLDKDKNMIYFTGCYGVGKTDFLYKFFNNYKFEVSNYDELINENYIKNNSFEDKKNFQLNNKKVDVHRIDSSVLFSNDDKIETFMWKINFYKKWLWEKSLAYKIVNGVILSAIAIISFLFILFNFINSLNFKDTDLKFIEFFIKIMKNKGLYITLIIILLLSLFLKIIMIFLKINIINSTYINLFNILNLKGKNRIFILDDLNRIEKEQKDKLYLLISSLSNSRNKFIIVDSLKLENQLMDNEKISKFFDVLIIKKVDSKIRGIIKKQMKKAISINRNSLFIIEKLEKYILKEDNIRLIVSFISKLMEYDFKSFIFNFVDLNDYIILIYCYYFRNEVFEKIKQHFISEKEIVNNSSIIKFDKTRSDILGNIYTIKSYEDGIFENILIGDFRESLKDDFKKNIIFSFDNFKSYNADFLELLQNGKKLEVFSKRLKDILKLEVSMLFLKKVYNFLSDYKNMDLNLITIEIIKKNYSISDFEKIIFIDFYNFKYDNLIQIFFGEFVLQLKTNTEEIEKLHNFLIKEVKSDKKWHIKNILRLKSIYDISWEKDYLFRNFPNNDEEVKTKFIDIEKNETFLPELFIEINKNFILIFNEIRKKYYYSGYSKESSFYYLIKWALFFSETNKKLFNEFKDILLNTLKNNNLLVYSLKNLLLNLEMQLEHDGKNNEIFNIINFIKEIIKQI